MGEDEDEDEDEDWEWAAGCDVSVVAHDGSSCEPLVL